jgi:ATP-dependent Lon protease
MNPVIYFDELDKVSDTPKGEEIIGILTHLIDSSQNSEFHDKYFSEIKFDLSKCLFIFSYNDESKINPILRDRMYKIETKGYDAKEKGIIARKHLLPSIRHQIDFKEEDLILTDEVLSYLIQNYTKEEKGVRNLKRCLEMIYTKMNLSRFTDTSTDFFKKAFLENVEFPYTLNNEDIDKLVIKGEQNPYLATLYT